MNEAVAYQGEGILAEVLWFYFGQIVPAIGIGAGSGAGKEAEGLHFKSFPVGASGDFSPEIAAISDRPR